MARLVVFGASGRTGAEVVSSAVREGHTVVAVTRNPSRLPTRPQVEVRRADVLDPASLPGLLDGADAVISALGPDDGRQPTQVYSVGMRAIVAEMRRTSVRRVVAVSAVPVSAEADKTLFERRVLHPVLWRFFGESYRDLRVMESELAQVRDVDWAVVRPPLLTDGPADTPLRLAWDEPLRGTRKITRAALAQTLVDTAVADPFRGGILTVTQAP